MSGQYAVQLFQDWQIAANDGWHGSEGFPNNTVLSRLDEVSDVSLCETFAVRNSDGRLYVFVSAAETGGNIATYHFWQKEHATQQDLGGTWAMSYASISGSSFASGTNLDGRMMVFCIDRQNRIQLAWQTQPGRGPWQARPFGGSAKKLSAVTYDGLINLFYIGMDDHVYHCWQTGTNNLQSWGSNRIEQTARRIAATVNVDGRLEVVFVGLDDTIYSVSQMQPLKQDGSWHFAPLGGQAKEITVGRNADGRLETVYIGMDNGVYHVWQSKPAAGPWAGGALGGYARQLALSQNVDSRLEYFYIGSDFCIYHNWQTAPNGDWNGNDPKLDGSFFGRRQPFSVAALWTGHGINVFYPTSIPPRGDPDGPGNDDGGGGFTDPTPSGGDVDQPD